MSWLSSRVVFSTVLVLLAVPALAAPPDYRTEPLDTGWFDEPSEALPQGGFLVDTAMNSPNGRWVVTLVADRRDPAGTKLLARIDRETDTAELIAEFELPVFPFGINDNGNIVVVAPLPGGSVRRVQYWSAATGPIPFGEQASPGQLASHGDGEGFPRILNNRGQVVVEVSNAANDHVLWDPVNDTSAVIGPNPGVSLSAASLNNHGQVVGAVVFPVSVFNEVDTRAFIWDEAHGLRVLEDLELISPNISPFRTFGRVARANAINDAGVIAGETRDEDFNLLGLIWESESTLPSLLPCQSPEMSQLPDRCAVWRLNDARDFVGGEEADEEVRSNVLWDGAEPFLLRDRIVEGATRCAIRSMANDGTLAGICEGAPSLVFPLADDDQPANVSDVLADPNPAPVDTEVRLSARVDDTGSGDSVITEARYTIDGGPPVEMAAEDGAFDGSLETVVADLPGFAEAGVYELCVTATDAAGNVSEPACLFLAVFDPAGGFATGGGWIDAPPGSFIEDPEAQGKANFGFVAKYRKDASVPTGSTEFQFHPGSLNFHSTGYDWLVITDDSTARFAGTGTVNGDPAPNGGPYRFMVWAYDGDPDTFRIRIWWDDATGEVTVFDSGTRRLGGGSIVIHGGG